MSGEFTSYDQLVFSGGGLRCFWQGGFLDVVRDPLGLDPERVTGVSGGALSAACFISHRGHDMLNRMRDAFRREDTNVTLHDIDGDHGLTPHQRVYREVVEDVLDSEARDRIAHGPAFEILLAHPPLDQVAKWTGTAMTLAYEAELHLINSPHFDWAEKLGLETSRVDARKAAADGTLTDLVCAAACIPPIFQLPDWEGRPVVDGGMADQAPMPHSDTGTTLVLLTRRYRNLPEVDGRRYVWPSEEVPADKIDFTDPDKLTQTWDIGLADGKGHLRQQNT